MFVAVISLATAVPTANTPTVELDRVALIVPGKESDPVSIGNEAEWVTADDYPIPALRAGSFGTTTTRLTIGTDGRVQRCDIEGSSGSTYLDNAACAALTARARFEPARDRRHRAVVGTYRKRVRWSLPDMSPVIEARPGYGNLVGYIARLHIGVDGLIDDCVVIDAANSSSPQPHPRQRQICDRLTADWQSDPAREVQPEGIWIELRQIRYIYSVDPRWNEPEPPSPPSDAIPVLPEGVT